MRKAFFLIASCLAVSASADQAADWEALGSGCQKFEMCETETVTGACAGTSQIVAGVIGFNTLTFDSTRSVGAPYACDVYASDNGYQATARQLVSASSITDSAKILTIYRGGFHTVWIECSTITTSVTINLYACP